MRIFEIADSSVVSDIIDGEVLIMDSRNGFYFSSSGPGAVIWRLIELSYNEDQIAARIAAESGADLSVVAPAIAEFLDQLLAHDLVRPASAGQTLSCEPPPQMEGNFVAPELAVYSDMQDLLLLDPIHDVSEAGWPTRCEAVPK